MHDYFSHLIYDCQVFRRVSPLVAAEEQIRRSETDPGEGCEVQQTQAAQRCRCGTRRNYQGTHHHHYTKF